MARKMTTKQFRTLIKEEASKLHRRTLLENEKKELMEEYNLIKESSIGEEEMDFLRTVKSTKPELYNRYINVVKRKGLEFALNDFHQHTEEGQKDFKQRERDNKKEEKLNDESRKMDEVLSMVSQREMAEYMAGWRSRMLSGEHVNDAPNKRFSREEDTYLSILASAYIEAQGLDDNLISKHRIAWDTDEDELSIFDDLRDSIRSERAQKVFDKKFKSKFGQIISEFL